MKKIIFTICVLLFAIGTLAEGADWRLANYGKRGLYSSSIEDVLALRPEEIDIGTAALIISEQWSNEVGGLRYLEVLDEMALELKSRLKKKRLSNSPGAVMVLNEYLFEEKGFSSVEEPNDPNDLFLHSVLDKRRGYCLSLSVLYLALGERLGLPLYGVVVPGHFFVRYDNGDVRFNIETTNKGGIADDQHYRRKFNIPVPNDSIYLENLNPRQTLGCLFTNFASIYNDMDNTAQALAAIKQAVSINPSLAEARTNLGNIYLKMGRSQDAADQYRKSLQLNDNDAKTHNNLGNVYSRLDKLNQAILSYEHSISRDPNFAAAYKNLANAYLRKEWYSMAIKNARTALQLEPDDTGSYNLLGNIYYKKTEYDQAIDAYQHTLSINPQFAQAYYGLANCFSKLQRYDAEIISLEKALAIKPDFVGALMNLGNAYFRCENFEFALAQYQKAAALKPEDALIHYNIGAAHSNLDNFEKAADQYERTIEIDPNMADAFKDLVYVYYRLEEYEKARQNLARAHNLGAEVDRELTSAIEETF
ncbi:MAG: tetratricopeptide repeat protein [Planctomycetes bacterium]|nr:tetratricopeptide repeat protein [Planctomycetota bacterium]